MKSSKNRALTAQSAMSLVVPILMSYSQSLMLKGCMRSLIYGGILVVLAAQFGSLSANAEDRLAPFGRSEFAEVALDGCVAKIDLFKRLRIEVPDQEAYIIRLDGSRKPLLALFRAQKSSTGLIALCQVTYENSGMALYHVDVKTKATRLLIRTHERLRPSELSFQQLANGNILMISNQGLIVQFRDQRYVDRFVLDGFYQEPTKMFPPIEGVVFQNRALFYSTVQARKGTKALHDLMMLEGNELKALSWKISGERPQQPLELLGPMSIQGTQVSFLESTGMLTVDFDRMESAYQTLAYPERNGQPLVPEKFFVSSTGRAIAVFRHSQASGDSRDIEMFDDGCFTRIAELDSGKWRMVPIGLDESPGSWTHAIAEDRDGRIWMTGTKNGRVIVRDLQGHYRTLASQPNLLYYPIGKITFEDERVHFHRAGSSQKRSLSREELFREVPQFTDWVPVRLLTVLVSDHQGVLYAISRKDGGQLLQIKDGHLNYFPLPDQEHPVQGNVDNQRLRITQPLYITTDSEGDVWLFFFKQQRVCVWDGTNWAVFGPDKKRKLDCVQVAVLDRLKKRKPGTAYRIGNDEGFKIEFSGPGEIVYRGPEKRVHFFDGQRWLTFAAPFPVPRFSSATPPFFHQDQIRIRSSSGEVYAVERNRLAPLDAENNKVPWKVVPQGSEPAQMRIQKLAKPALPTGFRRSYRLGDNWYSTGTSTATSRPFAISIAGRDWIVMDLAATPLADLRSRQMVAMQENLVVFQGGVPRMREHHVWFGPPVRLLQTDPNLGEITGVETELRPKFETKPPNLAVHYRYRTEGEPWSSWIPGDKPMRLRAFIDPGNQDIEVEFAFDDYLAGLVTCVYQANVTYSLKPEFDRLLKSLTADSFQAREAAMRKMIELGPAVLPLLKPATTSGNVELRARAIKIYNRINEVRFGKAAKSK